MSETEEKQSSQVSERSRDKSQLKQKKTNEKRILVVFVREQNTIKDKGDQHSKVRGTTRYTTISLTREGI